jgi:hypothetical protein
MGRQVLDQVPRQRVGLGHERVECRDHGLATGTHEIQYATAPFARVKAELVLQAHQVTRAVVRHFRSQTVGVPAVVVNNMDHPRVVVLE